MQKMGACEIGRGISCRVAGGRNDAAEDCAFLEKKKIVLPVFDRDGSAVFRMLGEASKKNLASRLGWLLSAALGKTERNAKEPVGVDELAIIGILAGSDRMRRLNCAGPLVAARLPSAGNKIRYRSCG
jgi:hypothetical protein